MSKVEEVNHPKRYKGSCSLECIEVMEVTFGYEAVVHFCLCNAFKYMWRFENKNGEEDLNKARWYLDYVEHKLNKGFEVSEEDVQSFRRLNSLYIDIWDKIANGEVELKDA